MARFLGDGSVIKSPRTTHTYTVASSERWTGEDHENLRPPAYIIGVGGFGVTYRVVDERGQAFAMKEYFPRDHARRATDGQITPRQSEGGVSRRIFDEGLRRFVAEGQLLTSFNHPSVNRVLDAFDANGTSYQIVRLVEGREQTGESDTGSARVERRVTLEDFLRELEAPGSRTQVDLALLEPVIGQLLDAVEYIHTAGSRKAGEITGQTTKVLIHRDIKPSNILIDAPAELVDATAAEVLRDPRTRALLIDFGSARIFLEGEQDDVSRSIGVVTEGYAPPELSDNQLDQQGPYTDIYSLAAVFWRALLGRKPSVTQLANGAKIEALATPLRSEDGVERPRAPATFLRAVDQALSASISARPQTIGDWRKQLFPAAPSKEDGGTRNKGATQTDQNSGTQETPKRPDRPILWLGLAAAALVAAAFLWSYLSDATARNIVAQAKAADADVEQALTIANAAIAEARTDADKGAQQADPGLAAAKQGYDNHSAYDTFMAANTIHDAGDSGSPEFGDKRANFDVGGFNVATWCHKKSSDVTPDADYSQYTTNTLAGVVPEANIDGEAGWACGIGHTHHRAYSGAQNPWQYSRDSYQYWGGVAGTGDSQVPNGLGQIKFVGDRDFGGIQITGLFSQPDSSAQTSATPMLEVSGVAQLGQVVATGKMQVANPSQPRTFELSGEMKKNGQVIFRGYRSHETPDFKMSAWRGWESRADGGELTGVWDPHGSGIMGSMSLPGGGVWRGLIPNVRPADAPAQAVAQTWGRLDDAKGQYWGQIVSGQPDGCGVLQPPGGRRQAGYFHAGVRQPGPVPEICKTARYERPFSPDAGNGR